MLDVRSFHGPPKIGFSLGPDALFGSYCDCDCTRTDYRDDILNWDYCTIYVLIVKHWRRLRAHFCRWWLVMQMWLWTCGDLLCWRLSNAASTKSQYFQESSLFDNLGFWVWGMCAFSENNSLLVSCLKLSYSNKNSGWVGVWGILGGWWQQHQWHITGTCKWGSRWSCNQQPRKYRSPTTTSGSWCSK